MFTHVGSDNPYPSPSPTLSEFWNESWWFTQHREEIKKKEDKKRVGKDLMP